jgi:small subunit ribosomal protein S19e
MSINETDAHVLITNVAKELKHMIKQPEWTPYVKTGTHKQRPPADKEWFFTRAASVLRTVAIDGPIGVSKLRVKYGGRKNRGYKPEKFVKGSGNVLRKALQELDKAGLTIQAEKGVHKGRIITPKGAKLLAKAGFKPVQKGE